MFNGKEPSNKDKIDWIRKSCKEINTAMDRAFNGKTNQLLHW